MNPNLPQTKLNTANYCTAYKESIKKLNLLALEHVAQAEITINNYYMGKGELASPNSTVQDLYSVETISLQIQTSTVLFLLRFTVSQNNLN